MKITKYIFALVLALSFLGAQPLKADHTEDHDASHETHATASGGSHENAAEEEEKSVSDVILHHVQDEHVWELPTLSKEHKYLYLPVLLWDDGQLHRFSSRQFFEGNHDGSAVVQSGNNHYVLHHEKIYKTDAAGSLSYDEEHEPTNAQPLDFSITKNVLAMFISVILLLIIMLAVAKAYRKHGAISAPRGLQSFVEPMILFVRDEVAIPNIGQKNFRKYMPYLLTIFFFILINNLLGLLPFFPGGVNVSGNLSFTGVLALFTFIIVTFSAKSYYWEHTLWMPGVPALIKIFILTPVEIVGMFVKPISLAIRLFANITGGHILVLSIVTLGIVFQSYLVGGVSVIFTVFISLIEILVAFLQAFIFTLLSAIYIGQAVEEGDH